MKEETEITYNHFRIFLNKWGEFCVLRKLTGNMVTYNSGFYSLEKAKKFVDKINPKEFDKQGLEKIAAKIKLT